MNLIGLTGGIGSGKSMVASIFNTLGIPVYNSDTRAKILLNENPEVRNKIEETFGIGMYNVQNELDTSRMASLFFNDREQLLKLNAIVHPAVYHDLLAWASQPEQSAAPYLIQESAIFIEENLIERLHSLILVVAPEELRIERVAKRDNISQVKVRERINNQWPDEKKIPFADFIIFNDGARSLIEQVRDIDQMIRNLLEQTPTMAL